MLLRVAFGPGPERQAWYGTHPAARASLPRPPGLTSGGWRTWGSLGEDMPGPLWRLHLSHTQQFWPLCNCLTMLVPGIVR
jgi:hypothetical protein